MTVSQAITVVLPPGASYSSLWVAPGYSVVLTCMSGSTLARRWTFVANTGVPIRGGLGSMQDGTWSMTVSAV